MSIYWAQALGPASSAVRSRCLCQVIWLAVISEGDLFAFEEGEAFTEEVAG
jgi:hypothetical protein